MCTDPIDGLTEIVCPTGVKLIDFTVTNSQYPEITIATIAVLFIVVMCLLFFVRRKKMAG